MKYGLFTLAIGLCLSTFAQKKPLDHTVYDSWQNIGEKHISNDGNWIVYSINSQEGDNDLVITSADGRRRKVVSRGYDARISEDSRFVVFRIRAWYKDLREARFRKKRPDEFPKDSLGILQLGTDKLWKQPGVRSYKMPEKNSGWLAYLAEKTPEPAGKTRPATVDAKKVADSLGRIIDSLQMVIKTMPVKKSRNRDDAGVNGEEWMGAMDADGDEAFVPAQEAGTTLTLRKLETGEEKTFALVQEYYFSKNGAKLLLEQTRDPKDSLSKARILFHDLHKGFADTLSRGGNDFRGFAMTDDGSQAAWIAERDAKPRDLVRYFRVWYFRDGMDSATLLLDKNTPGMKLGMTVSEYDTLDFSKSGKRLFFGTAPVPVPKDTSLVDIDLVKLDIWNYQDDYLQTQQLFRQQRDLRENFLAVYSFEDNTIRQLASREIPLVFRTGDGDGEQFVGVTDFGKRIESQWTGTTKKDIYAIKVKDGTARLVKKDLQGIILPSFVSPGGRYIMWYDSKAKNYYAAGPDSVRNLTARIKSPLYNEENDVPADPAPYGIMGWQEGDSAVYVYDRFDIWKVPVSKPGMPVKLLEGYNNRKAMNRVRYIKTDNEKQYFSAGDPLVLRLFNEKDKTSGYTVYHMGDRFASDTSWTLLPLSVSGVEQAKNTGSYIFLSESYALSPNISVARAGASRVNPFASSLLLSSINPQQAQYNWGTAELFNWKTTKGKDATGVLYKPEDFDPSKRYPVIIYFYEELSNGLYNYMPPAPTGSRVNISFFVSRGYIVFTPDIKYTIGHPAQSAYDYVVSGAKALARYKWIDAANMGLQGQSWGGIQVAQLITMTNMFKAAWAGAPVANMTSAYGGIRWESGSNRQFQYEKTQSRIGATLWEKPELYIENSPLFHLPAVKTPLVIMANDADGAVPWYQGIELFTAMRRLGKKVWMLNYNGEAHNLVERKNKKDIQVREQQFFDWLLKGDKPPKWITQGVPAVRKGKDWGLELAD